MQWKRSYAIVGGFGLGLFMWVLEMAKVTIPLWLLITLGIIALGMVVFGSIPIVATVSHGLKQTKIRNPMYMNSGVLSATPTAEKHSEAEKQRWEYPTQVRDKLDALIRRGDEFCHIMRKRDFSRWQIEPEVGEWLNDVNRDVWEIIPEHASYITANQGDLTQGEEIKYQGWDLDNAMLRVSVDRLLMRLREAHSKIRVVDTGGSRSE